MVIINEQQNIEDRRLNNTITVEDANERPITNSWNSNTIATSSNANPHSTQIEMTTTNHESTARVSKLDILYDSNKCYEVVNNLTNLVKHITLHNA